MAVPSSGQLRLRADIALEVDGSATNNNVSLNTLSNSAGFTDPDAMTDFYGYSNASAPSVTTNNASSVGASSFVANGNVTNDNGGTIQERGFYVGTSGTVTSNTKYTVSGTTGSYNSTISSLGSNTTYYITAFATNSAGTTFGSTVTQATTYSYSFRSSRHLFASPNSGASGHRYYQNVAGGWNSITGTSVGLNGCVNHEVSGRYNLWTVSGGTGTAYNEAYFNKQSVSGCGAISAGNQSASGGTLTTGTNYFNFSRWGSGSAQWTAS